MKSIDEGWISTEETDPIWNSLLENDYQGITRELKNRFKESQNFDQLKVSYMLDSISKICDKEQSITFLVDSSSSIGQSDFDLGLKFLHTYVAETRDTISNMAIHFYNE